MTRIAPAEGNEAFVAVGSNLEPRRNVPRALAALQERVHVVEVSRFYWNPARLASPDAPAQPEYLNGIFRIRACAQPPLVKAGILRPVEAALGRRRSGDRYAPRPIDLDLIVYIEDAVPRGLRVVDPEIATRPFLAVPLAELAPDLELPFVGETVARLADRLDRSTLRYAAQETRALRDRLRLPAETARREPRGHRALFKSR